MYTTHSTTPPQPDNKPRIRVWFVLSGTLITLAVLALIAPPLGGFVFMLGLITPGCSSGPDPEIDGWETEAVAFDSYLGSSTFATLISGREPRVGATVIAIPTLGLGLNNRYEEFVHYLEAGYDVLTMQSVTCMGAPFNSLGYLEVQQVGDAIAFLDGQREENFIAVHGYSAGGATAIMAAARFPQIDAVVSQGGYGDFVAEMRQNTTSNLPLISDAFEFGARVAYRMNLRQELEVLSPQSAIERITRPILLVYGTLEPALGAARQMRDLNAQWVTLWEVEGATHGAYVQNAPDEYPVQVVGFLDRAFGITR